MEVAGCKIPGIRTIYQTSPGYSDLNNQKFLSQPSLRVYRFCNEGGMANRPDAQTVLRPDITELYGSVQAQDTWMKKKLFVVKPRT